MYKVLIAEDELLVRIGIKSTILESQLPLAVIGDTSNGLSAYDLFVREHPDIVITDIKMPGIDGIELIKKIRVEDKDCAIIIISCLEDFNILKQTMENNVSAYLLKATMTLEEITSSLKKAIDDLNGRNRFGLVNNMNIDLFMGEAIAAFLNGSILEKELVNQLENIEFSPNMMAVFFLKGRKLDNVVRQSLEEVIRLRLSNAYKTLSFIISDECLVFLMNGTEKNIVYFLKELQHYIEETFLLNSAIIVKNLNGTFHSFPTQIKRCFVEKEELDYFEINHPVQDNWMGMLPYHVNMFIRQIEPNDDIAKTIHELDLDSKKYQMYIEKIQNKAEKGKHAFIDVLIETIEKLYPSGNKVLEIQYQLLNAPTYKIAMRRYLKYLHDACIKQSFQSIRPEVKVAVQYINEHFMESLTLNKVASIVGLTANYFSNVFTKEIGQSFISYLNKIRIEKAKQFLIQDNLLIYEIAHRVGFEDEAYFCRMFKKITGKSPKEWRTLKNILLYKR